MGESRKSPRRMEFRGTKYSIRGAMQEMAATLSRAKSEVDAVMQELPDQVYGSAYLEEAIGMIGRVESELDTAADEETR